MKALREWLGTAADLISVGTFAAAVIGLIVVGALTDWLDTQVPVWALLAVALAGVVGIGVVHWAHRNDPQPGAEDLLPQIELLEQEIDAGTTYLAQIKDFLALARSATDGRSPAEAADTLEKARAVVFTAVIQGTNTTRGEQIRCAYFEPDPNDPALLMIKEHHGHPEDHARNLRLRADHGSIAGRAFTEGAPVYSDDAANDQRLQIVPGGSPIGSLYCEPVYRFLGRRSEVIGVFSVAAQRKDAFTLADQQFIAVCAHILAFLGFLVGIFQARGRALAKAEARRQLPGGERPTGGG